MKKVYILKNNLNIPDDLKERDNLKRIRVEEILDKKLSDIEWVNYKKLVRGRNKS